MRTINQTPLAPKTPLTTIKTFLHNVQSSVRKFFNSVLTLALQIVVLSASAIVASILLVYIIFVAILATLFKGTINTPPKK